MSVSGKIFWLRSDLRLSDQPVWELLSSNEHILFYYSEYYSDAFFAPIRPAIFRSRFIQQSLSDLENRLALLKYEFRKSVMNPLEEIPLICEAQSIRNVYCNRGFSWYERWQDLQLKERLHSIGVSMIVMDADRFPWLPENTMNPKSIFTDYRFKMEPLLARLKAQPSKSQMHQHIAFSEAMALSTPKDDSVHAIVGGESHAFLRLSEFVRKGGGIENYIDTRNGMLGHEYSSLLSPYLAAGCCTAAQVFEAVKCFEAENGETKSSYWLIFELLWRSYFKWVSHLQGQRIFQTVGYNGKKSRAVERDPLKLIEWICGETKEPLVNACMRELAHTGYMGNRARQIAASYLIHDLEVEWIWGARYFEYMLVDYDACSNYGNWAYLSGVGSDPRPNRRFNPLIQQEKYDPDRAYVNYWTGSSAISMNEATLKIIMK